MKEEKITTEEETINDSIEEENQSNDSDEKDNKKEKKSSKKKKNKDDKLKERINELENNLQEKEDKFLRLFSEFDNYRKRTSKERLDLLKNASADIIAAILPVIDDFERAMLNQKEKEEGEAENADEGITLIYNKLTRILAQNGLKEMECMGEAFNPDLHEAIAQSPAPKDDLKGKIIDVVEKGYYVNDKLIRFAKVVVGN